MWTINIFPQKIGDTSLRITILDANKDRSSSNADTRLVNTTLETFWAVDSLGLSDEGTVYDQFKNDIYFNSELYTTKLPFKKHEYLPNNYQLL